MKKMLLTLLVIVSLVVLFFTGFEAGKLHTVTNGRISIDGEYYLLDIDGQLYAHYID